MEAEHHQSCPRRLHHAALDHLNGKLTDLYSHLVDVFAMVPQNAQRLPAAFAGQDARLLQYRDVLAKISDTDDEVSQRDGAATDAVVGAIDWPSDEEDDDALDSYKVVKTEGAGRLLGGFADV